MKRYQSAFAAPSGFVISAGKSAKAARRAEIVHRSTESQGLASAAAKPRPIREIRGRAA